MQVYQEKVKKKIKMPKIGYKQTKEHRARMKGRIPWNKGKRGLYKTSEETKKKLKWIFLGNKNAKGKNLRENNGNWNGGTSDKKLHPERLTSGRIRPNHCDVCGNTGRICFDHNHQTGEFRGWLCAYCNMILGYAKDNANVLISLSNYLKKHDPISRDHGRKKDIRSKEEDTGDKWGNRGEQDC